MKTVDDGDSVILDRGVGVCATHCAGVQVPQGGNGRSRNEWVSAFNSLMCRKLPIYQPAESES